MGPAGPNQPARVVRLRVAERVVRLRVAERVVRLRVAYHEAAAARLVGSHRPEHLLSVGGRAKGRVRVRGRGRG